VTIADDPLLFNGKGENVVGGPGCIGSGRIEAQLNFLMSGEIDDELDFARNQGSWQNRGLRKSFGVEVLGMVLRKVR
jgi:hypothetical protein